MRQGREEGNREVMIEEEDGDGRRGWEGGRARDDERKV